MASWGSCDFHELRDLNERIKAAASEQEMDAFYTGLLDEMMNGLLTDVKELTPVDRFSEVDALIDNFMKGKVI